MERVNCKFNCRKTSLNFGKLYHRGIHIVRCLIREEICAASDARFHCLHTSVRLLFCVNLFYNLHTNIPTNTHRARADLTDMHGQSVECGHALLVDDLRRRAVLPESLIF